MRRGPSGVRTRGERFGPRFGIGVSAFANINGMQSFGGTALAFSLGRLR